MLSVGERRGARVRMFYATVWGAMGNAFLTANVIYLMARCMGVTSGVGVSLIYLTPWMAGLFRWFTPVGIQLFQSQKRFVLNAGRLEIFFLMTLILFPLPLYFQPLTAYLLLLFGWLGACLAEHCAFVAMLSWQGAIFPEKTRGRFFGFLERWKLGGEIGGLAATLFLTWIWQNGLGWWVGWEVEEYWVSFPFLVLGTLFLWRRLQILKAIPEKTSLPPRSFSLREQWFRLKKPFRDRHFRPMLVYGAFFSLVTQLDQVAQVTLPYFLTSWGFLLTQGNRFFVKTGQFLLGGRCGRWLDRWGAPRVILLSQYGTSLAPLFYVLALTEGWGWLLVGQIFWISYVGLNIGLPQIQLQMAPHSDTSPWAASYGLVCSLFGCMGMLLGGLLFDHFASTHPHTYYATTFTLSASARLLAALPLCWLLWKGCGEKNK